jgi:hypothetical protein
VIVLLVRVLTLSLGAKVVKAIGYFVASLVVLVLFAAPMLGILVQPLAPFWLSVQCQLRPPQAT